MVGRGPVASKWAGQEQAHPVTGYMLLFIAMKSGDTLPEPDFWSNPNKSASGANLDKRIRLHQGFFSFQFQLLPLTVRY